MRALREENLFSVQELRKINIPSLPLKSSEGGVKEVKGWSPTGGDAQGILLLACVGLEPGRCPTVGARLPTVRKTRET